MHYASILDALCIRDEMKTLTVKNISDDLYDRLGKDAKANRRSLNQHVIFQLERLVLAGSATAAEDELADLDDFRESLGFTAYDADITEAKREGRP